MKLKNYFLLLFTVFSVSLAAQTDNLIIKSIHNESSFYSTEKADTYYFTIVELRVLNAAITIGNYQLKYKNGVTSGNTTRNITSGNFNSRYVSGYTGGIPDLSESPTSLDVGSSFYFVEMYRDSDGTKVGLTNTTLYIVFQEYFGLSDAEMMGKKYFTVNSTFNYDFDGSVTNSSSVLTIRNGTSAEDVWKNGVSEGTYAIRTTLTPTTSFNASQWTYTATLATQDELNNLEEEVIPNPIASGARLSFKDNGPKVIRIFDVSGLLKDEKTGVSEQYIVPENLIQGMYFLHIQSENGRKVYKVIIR